MTISRARVVGLRTLRRFVAIGAIATALELTGSSPAFADSVTSPTGMLTISAPAPVFAGIASTYTVTVTNNTTSLLIGIVLEGDLPSGMTLSSLRGCDRLGGNQTVSILCTMPNLPGGTSETATVAILASTAGTFNLPLTVSGGIPVVGSPGALQIIGDSATLAVNVQPGPTDLQVTGSSNNGSPPVGTTFTYTFQVKDNGPLPASGVTFDDALPSSILLGSSLTTSTGSCSADASVNKVHCDIGALAVGQQAVISFSASPAKTGTFGDTATVAMVGTDTQPANNSVTVTVQPK